MNNKKLQLHKELLTDALSVLKRHEDIEDCYDFDPEYVEQHEQECILEYSTKLAGIMQLAFNQVNVFPAEDLITGKNNAKPLGTIVIDNSGKATAL